MVAVTLQVGNRRPWPNTVRFIVCAVFTCIMIGPRGATAGADEAGKRQDKRDHDEDMAAEALVFDVEKLVFVRGQRGWTIDRYEYRELLADALMSVCRAPAPIRERAVAMLADEVTRVGGPLETIWRPGLDEAALKPVLFATRSLELLRLAIQRASRDCPIYMAPLRRFGGLQGDAGYVTLNAEGGGLFTIRRRSGDWQVGGGGGGRVLLGYGLSPRWLLRAGGEVGGAALVDETVRADSVDVDFFAAVPITIRRVTPAWNYDLELAPLGAGVPWRAPLRYGLRVGMLMGLSYVRVRSVLPSGAFGLHLEYIAGRGAIPAVWSVRMGVRVGFAIRLLRVGQ